MAGNGSSGPGTAPASRRRFYLALGTVGMSLSEAGSWNYRALAGTVAARGPLAALPGVALTLAVYTLLFALLFDACERRRVRDAAGLLLLASLYGLANEGLFAPHLVGPRGLNPVFLLFPTLSWHAYVDGALTVLVARAWLAGRIDLSGPALAPREAVLLAGFCALWFPWSFAPWLPPAPPVVPALFLAAPFLLLVLIAPGGGRAPDSPFPRLTERERRFAWITLAAVGILRHARSPVGAALLLLVAGLYVALFRLSRPVNDGEGGDAAGLSVPVPRPLSRSKLLRAALLAGLLFAAWRVGVPALGLAPAVARGCQVAAVLSGIALPPVTLLLAGRAWWNRRSGSPSG